MSWDTDTDRQEWFRCEVLPLEPMLRAYIRRLAHPVLEVDDLVQDVMTRIITYENWRNITTPMTFVMKIARNLVFDEFRRRKVVSISFLPDMDVLGRAAQNPGPEAALLARDELNLVLEAVAEMSPQCRRVFTLRKVYCFPPNEIAERLGLSVSTVEKHLVKALRLCSERLAQSSEGHIKEQPRKLWPVIRNRFKTR